MLSGSDCGRVFVWDKWTGEVVNMFTADSHVVNCIQPHPAAHSMYVFCVLICTCTCIYIVHVPISDFY